MHLLVKVLTSRKKNSTDSQGKSLPTKEKSQMASDRRQCLVLRVLEAAGKHSQAASPCAGAGQFQLQKDQNPQYLHSTLLN